MHISNDGGNGESRNKIRDRRENEKKRVGRNEKKLRGRRDKER